MEYVNWPPKLNSILGTWREDIVIP